MVHEKSSIENNLNMIMLQFIFLNLKNTNFSSNKRIEYSI